MFSEAANTMINRLRPRLGAAALAAAFTLALAPELQARDKYVPFVEPLAAVQQRAAAAAAPQGQDEPLMVSISTQAPLPAVAPETSRLEAIAEAKADMNSIWTPNETWRDLIFAVLEDNGLSPHCDGCDWTPAE